MATVSPRITEKRVTSGDKTEDAWADFHICGFSTGLPLPRKLTARGEERRCCLPDDDNDGGDFDGGERYLSRICRLTPRNKAGELSPV